MHFCSAHGIEPHDVDQAVFDGFGQALRRDSFIRNQRVAHQNAARLWNRAVATLPGWPQVRLEQPRYAKPYVLRLETFPAAFQADVELWLSRLAGDGLLDEGPARPLRPRSLEQRRFYLRQAASALVRAAVIRPRITGLADLVTVEAMQAILRFFLARSGNRPTSQIHGLATHLKAISRHHVGVTPDVLEQLGRMVRRVAPPQTGLALKNRLALKQFVDPVLLERLIRLPDKVYATLPAGRDAVAATRLPCVSSGPWRSSSCSRPRSGSATSPGSSSAGTCCARQRQAAAALPPRDPWRGSQKRPPDRAAAAGCDERPARALPHPGPAGAGSRPTPAGCSRARTVGARPWSPWAARSAASLSASSALRLTPHQFRHLVGFVHLRRNRKSHEAVRALLGHRSINTTLRHYAGLEGAAAARHYDEILRAAAAAPTGPSSGQPVAGRRAAVPGGRPPDAARHPTHRTPAALCPPPTAWPAADRAAGRRRPARRSACWTTARGPISAPAA